MKKEKYQILICDLCNKSYYINKKDDPRNEISNNHYNKVCAECFEELCRCFRIEILYG